jgi:hypothetical protein
LENIRFISYFTIALILFQSFSAVANSVDFHATDPQHLQKVHQHSDDHSVGSLNEEPSDKRVKKRSDSKDATASHHNPADCHHCGHCNGTHIQWVGQNALRCTNLAKQSHKFHYLRAVIDAPINQLLRPPKV